MIQTTIKELLQQEAQAVLNIPVTDAYEKAVSLIVEQVHEKGGKLVTSGMGKAGQIAMNIATTFCSTGIPSVFLHPSEAQHGDLGILQKNDLLLLISNSGKTREIVELTGSWEKTLLQIEQHTLETRSFMHSIESFTSQVTREVLGLKFPAPKQRSLPCPKCGTGTLSA